MFSIIGLVVGLGFSFCLYAAEEKPKPKEYCKELLIMEKVYRHLLSDTKENKVKDWNELPDIEKLKESKSNTIDLGSCVNPQCKRTYTMHIDTDQLRCYISSAFRLDGKSWGTPTKDVIIIKNAMRQEGIKVHRCSLWRIAFYPDTVEE